MMGMKGKAIEKLMSVLDEVLGEDVSGRVKKALASEEKSPEMEESEEEGMPPSEKGQKVASGGSAILALPEIGYDDKPLSPYPKDEEDTSEMDENGNPKGVGIEVKDVKVAAMPRPGLMKKMRGKV